MKSSRHLQNQIKRDAIHKLVKKLKLTLKPS